MKMLCFKFHQNQTINEVFDFWRVKASPRGAGGPDLKKIRKPHTERWPQPTPKISGL